MKNRAALKGMTLLELLLGLVLLAILLACFIPFGQAFVSRHRLNQLSNQVTNIIRFAKAQALAQQKNLILSPLPGSIHWSRGMSLFIDNPDHKTPKSCDILHEWHFKSAGLHIDWKGFYSNQYLLFSADLKHNATNGYFLIKDKWAERQLILNRLGRVRIVDQRI